MKNRSKDQIKTSLQRSATPSGRVEDVVLDYSAQQHVCQDAVQHFSKDREAGGRSELWLLLHQQTTGILEFKNLLRFLINSGVFFLQNPNSVGLKSF